MPRTARVAVFLLVAAALVGGAMFLTLARRFDAAKSYENLEAEMRDAQDAHIEAVIAERNRKEAGTAAAEPAQPKRDPRPDVLDRMDALAQRAQGTPEGATIAIGLFAWTWQTDAPPSKLTAAFERIARHYPNDPVVETALDVVGSIAESISQPDAWIAPLEELARTTKSKSTRIAALMTLGRLRLHAGQPAAAKAAFQNVLDSQPAMDTEKRAKGYLFEADHLQVGMIAPDFTTQTMDGQDINLASLRGKTVLLNFWASW